MSNVLNRFLIKTNKVMAKEYIEKRKKGEVEPDDYLDLYCLYIYEQNKRIKAEKTIKDIEKAIRS